MHRAKNKGQTGTTKTGVAVPIRSKGPHRPSSSFIGQFSSIAETIKHHQRRSPILLHQPFPYFTRFPHTNTVRPCRLDSLLLSSLPILFFSSLHFPSNPSSLTRLPSHIQFSQTPLDLFTKQSTLAALLPLYIPFITTASAQQ